MPTPPDPSGREPARRGLSRTVLALGVVSLLTDAASDMVWPLLGVFLVEHLHRSVSYVGLIEGIAEATAAVGKYLAGRYSDRVARRQPVVLAGYALSSLARPLVALAASPWHALAVRFADRVGKGVRSSPRDAILAADARDEDRAGVFGFHRAMDNLGAVAGPLLASLVLYAFPGRLRLVFALSAIPGALAVLTIALFVRDRPREPADLAAPRPLVDPGHTGARFRRYLAVVAVFALANASDLFLVTKARAVGVPLRHVPLFWAALSFVRAAAATPGGRLADRIGRPRALAIGWTLYALVYAGLAFARTPVAFAALLVPYGAYYGLTEGAEKALVASFAPRASLGRAYGMFALVTGLCAIPASVAFGALYPVRDGAASFLLSAALALVAALAMARWGRERDGSDTIPAS